MAENSSKDLEFSPPCIIVVDDEPVLLEEVIEFLGAAGILAAGAHSAEEAMRLFNQSVDGSVTVVLTDIKMAGMDGMSLAKHLRQSLPEDRGFEVIVMTGRASLELAVEALRADVFDFLVKPLLLGDLVTAIQRAHAKANGRRRQSRASSEAKIFTEQQISLSRYHQDLNKTLQDELRQQTLEAESIQDASLIALALVAETRDNQTGQHIKRTQSYVLLLIEALRHHPNYNKKLADLRYCQLIIKSSALHDLGKVGIPDSILLKPGPLSAEEFTIMKTHVTIGANVIEKVINAVLEKNALEHLPASLEFLEIANQIATSHHEKWDGTGYPKGLKGEAIPLPGRLMILADIFDALLSKRPYKSALEVDHAVRLIVDGRGTYFDPAVVEGFLSRIDDFKQIAAMNAEPP